MIEFELRSIGNRAAKVQRAFDLASFQAGGDLLPKLGFLWAQFVRQAKLNVEITMVYGTEFPG